MAQVSPSCPTGHVLNADFCSCDIIPPLSDPDKTESPASPSKSPKRKRCPNGTRKNKEGVCVPKTTGVKSAAKKRTRKKEKIAKLIQDMDDVLDRNKAKSGKKTRKRKAFTMIKNMTPSLLIDAREELPPLDTPGAQDMYSPSLNKYLVASIHNGSPRHNILDSVSECFHKQYTGGAGTPPKLWFYIRDELEKKSPSLKLYVGNRCLKWNNKSVTDMLLRNLAKTSQIKVEDITAPRQMQSNCWFNCGFMIYFISDLGRKFSKYLRQYMITGNIVGQGKTRRNIKLGLQFFILNLAIEACIQGHPLAMDLDTNDIIDGIYKSLPQKQTVDTWMVKSGHDGNPTHYYDILIKYLTGAAVRPVRIDTIYWMEHENVKPLSIPDGIAYKYSTAKEDRIKKNRSEWVEDQGQDFDVAPSIMRIVLNLEGMKYPGPHIPMHFTCEFGKYRLDSALIGDTTGVHFCSMVTINGKYYAFDGNSFSKLSPFRWPEYLNDGRSWGFEGSIWGESSHKTRVGKNIVWNFRKCYHELYYYRVQ